MDASYVDLLKIAGHNDLFDIYLTQILLSESKSKKQQIEDTTDIKVLLEQSNNITFNGHIMTADEADRALAMFYLLFPHYKEPEN